jgi:hypothetical protein
MKIDYSTYRRINFQKDAAVWGGTPTPFSIQLFAPGFLYKALIDIDVVENGQPIPVALSESSFNVPDESLGRLLAEIGKYAGFRLHYPINRADYDDEFVVFQGASYFRGYPKDSCTGCPHAVLPLMWQGPKAKNSLCSNASGSNGLQNIRMRLSSMRCWTVSVSQGRTGLVSTPGLPPGWMWMSPFSRGRMWSKSVWPL